MACIVPHEVVETEDIKVTVAGVETLIYATVKRDYAINGEYGGQAHVFVFDPAAKPTFIRPDLGIRITLAVQ